MQLQFAEAHIKGRALKGNVALRAPGPAFKETAAECRCASLLQSLPQLLPCRGSRHSSEGRLRVAVWYQKLKL